MEIETSADPAVLWLRARQLCYLDGHVPQSGEIVGILRKLKDDMPTDLADSLKADEEDRKTDHAPLVQVKANEVATVTATIETNLRQGGALVKEEVATGDVTAVKTRHTLWCVVFLLSHDLSQVHRKGDLVDEDDAKKGDTIMLLNGDDDGRPSEERQKSRAE